MKILCLIVDSQHHFEILASFCKKGDDVECLILGDKENLKGDLAKTEAIQKKYTLFPTAGFKSDFIYQDMIHEKLQNIPWIINTQDIAESKDIESYSVRLMDRSSIQQISGFNRKRIFLILLNYFTYKLQNCKPDAVLCFDEPHSFFDIIPYMILKKRGCNIVMHGHHYLDGCSLFEVYTQSKNISALFLNTNKKPCLFNIQEEDIKSSKFFKAYKHKEQKRLVAKGIQGKAKLISSYLLKTGMNITMGTFPFLFKKELLHFNSLNNQRVPFFYRISLSKSLFSLIQYNWHYNKLAKDVDLGKPYIFFAMHMQPEKTSTPQAEDFDNQIIPIKILHDSLPAGMKIYVKEHPNQFNVRKVPNKNFRNLDFYNTLMKLPNVELVNLKIDSDDLLANASFVATLTGTVGWEALSIGKPVLLFGRPYYRFCKGTRSISDVKSCKTAIDELSKLTSDEIFQSLKIYVNEVNYSPLLIHANFWDLYNRKHPFTPKEQIVNIANSFYEILKTIDEKV